jgi:uncharacterized membrane protein YqjE
MATTDTPPSATEPIAPEKDLSELVSELTTDIGNLVSTHIELAKVEIKEEVKKAGLGAGLLSGAGIAALFTLLLLSFAAAWGLSEIVPEGVAFLIVGVVVGVVAWVLITMGRKKIAEVQPVPQTMEELKDDARWVRQQTS